MQLYNLEKNIFPPMNISLQQAIEKSTALRQSRKDTADFVLENQDLFPELLGYAMDVSYLFHHKACWILEWVFNHKPIWFKEYLDLFFTNLPLFDHDGARRSIARIAMQIITEQNEILPCSPQQLQIAKETFLDWLISNTKVASKVYAMKSIYYMSKNDIWLKDILLDIIQKDYESESAAFRAASKEIIRNYKKHVF